MNICGIDIHKSFLQIAVIDSRGNIVYQERCRYSLIDIILLIAKLAKMRCREIAMESTGCFWIPLFYEFAGRGFKTVLANPSSTKSFGSKTDMLDAVRIARRHRAGALIKSYVPRDRVKIIFRSISRLRRRLKEDRNRVLNRIRRLLTISGVWLDRFVKPNTSRWFSMLEMLASGKSLNEILGLNIGYEYHCMRDRLDCYEANILAQLLSLARRIDEICSFLSKMAESLVEKLYGEEYSLIQTVPGIGRTLAYMILAEIDDVRRFPSARHFKSYCGLSPSLRESGGKARLGRCRHGNPYLRYAFYQAAVVAIRVDDELKRFYDRLRARGKHHKVALIAVAGKLAIRTWHILCNNEKYIA